MKHIHHHLKRNIRTYHRCLFCGKRVPITPDNQALRYIYSDGVAVFAHATCNHPEPPPEAPPEATE